jgi:hypothetical protein
MIIYRSFTGLIVSAVIFGVLYFTVIKPNSDSVNHIFKQSQSTITAAEQQANQQVQQAAKTPGSSLGTAQKLTACVAAAGTDTTKIQACESRFHP